MTAPQESAALPHGVSWTQVTSLLTTTIDFFLHRLPVEWWGCSHQLMEKRGAASHTCFHRKEGASGITEHTEHVLQRGTRDQESLERRLLTGLCTRLSISGKGRKAHILPSHFYTIGEEEEVTRDTCPEDTVVLRAVECPLTTRLLYRNPVLVFSFCFLSCFVFSR